MDDIRFHRAQLARFLELAQRLEAIAGQPEHAQLAGLAEQFRELSARPQALLDEAPPLVFRLFTVAPGVAQGFPRDLLWYLGGECLHFMPDDEIERYSALDDDRRAAAGRGETFDWSAACAALPTLH